MMSKAFPFLSRQRLLLHLKQVDEVLKNGYRDMSHEEIENLEWYMNSLDKMVSEFPEK